MENFLTYENYRGTIYQLLADAYKLPEEPKEMIEINETLLKLLPLLEESTKAPLEELLEELEGEGGFESIRKDHLLLFVGPKTLLAPPYGSLYLEQKGQLMGPSTRDAMRLYAEGGAEKAEDFKEPPDHLRIELEFMAHLVKKVIERIEGLKNNGDTIDESINQCEKYLSLQEEFLTRHLGSWIRPFTNNLLQKGKSKYYRNLGKVTEVFIRKEATEVLSLVKMELQALKEQIL